MLSMEYDNDENSWTRHSTNKMRRRGCMTAPRRSTTTAVIVLGLAVLSCLLGYCVLSETLPYESKTLRQVVILFRHGARTPIFTYNSDPFKNYQWPGGKGALTNAGKLQLYELGKKYRNYYANFIPEDYLEKDVYIRSSDKSRCLMSAYTFLAGLFPPSENQTWHPEILWQPIPVHSLPKDLDDIVAGTKPCKLYNEMYYQLLNETSSKNAHAPLYSFLSENMNETVKNVVDVNYIYSSLLAQLREGLTLPKWSEDVFPEKLLPFYTLSLALLSYNDSMQRLRVGPLLNNIKNHLEDIVRNNEKKRKLHIYSGHDVNVVSLWRAFGFKEMLNPEYGASLALELHKNDGEDNYYIKVFLRNSTNIEIPQELHLPQCGPPCSYKDFIRHIDKLIPVNWNRECKNYV